MYIMQWQEPLKLELQFGISDFMSQNPLSQLVYSKFVPPSECKEMRDNGFTSAEITHWIDAKLSDRKWHLVGTLIWTIFIYVFTFLQVRGAI